MPLPTRNILGIPIAVTDYDSALAEVVTLSASGRPAAISASNTHLVSLARHDPSFRRILSAFDINLPDGIPLIWSLNAQGAKLVDRVYGPYFMRHVLQRAPAFTRHFFFGGTQGCLDAMMCKVRKMRPEVRIVGAYSPPYRKWTDEEEAEFARIIRDSGADFIWVALGGGRQERWIASNLSRHERGVFVAVGDAFELLAGSRPFAPEWMQKAGLTWLYRLYQEPRRLWSRYLRYNSMYLYYQVRDWILGTPALDAAVPAAASGDKPKIAFMGSRGVPARYSGFEVVVEELGLRLAERGYEVTVYNRLPDYHAGATEYGGMRIVGLPTIPTKSLDTIIHTFLSVLHSFGGKYDIVYLCGVGNAILAGILKWFGYRVILNVDGADFRRAKWGPLGRMWLRLSERWASRLATHLIADNGEIVRRYEREHQRKPVFISYGCLIRTTPVCANELQNWGLKPNGYILYVARLTPENAAELLLKAFAKYRGNTPLVICGSAYHERRHYEYLRSLADERVIFTGPRYGDAYVELSQNAKFFVMPAAIEATRLVLLDQMGMGKAILYRDCAASREVLDDTALPFSSERPEESLAEEMANLDDNPALCDQLGKAALRRAEEKFSWDRVVDQYEVLFGVRKA